MHYGLLPRANRGIFAINELPDLAGKIQVGLFNILQEGDVQIKGYPVRLRLDVLMAFTANPEDYTARGKIITPLKDRIGSEIRTHYAATRALAHGHHAPGSVGRAARRHRVIDVPSWVREVVEEIAFQARTDRRIDKRSGVSQRLPISVLENVASNAERRALTTGEGAGGGAHRGHLRGAAGNHRQVRARIRRRAQGRRRHRAGADPRRHRQRLRRVARRVRHLAHRGLVRQRRHAAARRHDARRGVPRPGAPHPGPAREACGSPASTTRPPATLRASAVEFILEGLAATRKIGRTSERGYQAADAPAPRRAARREEPTLDDLPPMPGGKKKVLQLKCQVRSAKCKVALQFHVVHVHFASCTLHFVRVHEP